jgi:hypothetical protein
MEKTAAKSPENFAVVQILPSNLLICRKICKISDPTQFQVLLIFSQCLMPKPSFITAN